MQIFAGWEIWTKWYVLGNWKIVGVWGASCWALCVRNLLALPPPPTPTEGVNVALKPHPNSYQTPPPPPLKGWILPYGLRLLGNFQVSQVAGWRCTLLAGNLFISLAGSEEQINFSQQSPKILKIASDIFIRAFLLFLSLLFQNFLLGALVIRGARSSRPLDKDKRRESNV